MKKKFYLSLIAALGLEIYSHGQNIYTFAGTGTSGFSGDGGPASLANIADPDGGIARDASGNIYFADINNHRVRKINTSGIISTIAGTGGAGFSGDGGLATSAQLNFPKGVAVDAGGNIYISDAFNCRIRKVSPTGTITTFAGTGSCGFSGDGGLAINAQINSPNGMCFDATGALYFWDANSRIRKITPTGSITTVVGTGTPGYSGDGGSATLAKLNTSGLSIAFDAVGNLYIPDTQNFRIRMVNTSGTITTICGTGTNGFSGDWGPANAAQISRPDGISVDGSNNIYFTDRDNNRVRKISSTGTITTIAGNGLPSYSGDGGNPLSAELNWPMQVMADGLGNIFIGDYFNYRIRVICSTNCPVVAGVKDLSLALPDIGIYPNPSKDILYIKSDNSAHNIEIISVLGKVVFTSSETVLNISELSGGIYTLRLNAGENIRMFKLIKE